MQIFLITIITAALTFLAVLLGRTSLRKRPFRIYGYKVHHSALGILLLVIGIILGNEATMSIGLGIYLGHVIEEIYFNKTNYMKAFFIFVTR